MFYNKPNGMAHFLKNAHPPVLEAVVALIDPDMILMSPLAPNVGENRGRGAAGEWKHENGILMESGGEWR